MVFLERKVPPVALFILFVVALVLVDKYMDAFHVGFPLPTLVLTLLVALATFIGLAGVYEFRKADTTVNPVHVNKASTVVDSGVFAYTRNPMYLGLVMVLFAVAYWLQNAVGIVLPIVFIVYMNRFQIKPEEKALEQLFGAAYLDYKQRVRRWI